MGQMGWGWAVKTRKGKQLITAVSCYAIYMPGYSNILITFFFFLERKGRSRHTCHYSALILVHVTAVQPLMILSSFSLFSLFRLDGKNDIYTVTEQTELRISVSPGLCVLQFRRGKKFIETCHVTTMHP